MIRPAGVIFDAREKNSTQPVKEKEAEGGLRKDLDGDSGVGQALEFPSKSLSRALKKKQTSTSRFYKTLGNALILFSILGFLATYGPIIKVELGYRLSRLEEESVTPKGRFADIIGKELLGEPEGVPDPNFSLIIPKIHAKGKVVPNVDPGNEPEYIEALKEGVAHARGTDFPGGTGNIYLFAHSTDSPINVLRYNAIFYLLREMEVGDEVLVYFGGVKHRYTVVDKKIVEPTDVSYLLPTNSENQEQLILQTCWPPGTTFKRLLVFARKSV